MIRTLRHCSNPSTLRRNGSCELERLNHLPWVVKVIQITKFRVVIQKVIQILPNLASLTRDVVWINRDGPIG